MLPTITHLFRVSRPLELKYGQSGKAYGSIGIVCSEKYQDKETKLWVNGTAFGKTAELMATIPKGAQVFVKGKMLTEEWTAQDGAKKSKTAMTIETFQFVDKKTGGQYDNVDRPEQHNVAGAMNRPTEGQRMEHTNADGSTVPVVVENNIPEIDINEDEIPF